LSESGFFGELRYWVLRKHCYVDELLVLESLSSGLRLNF
jgi:hypothetical protein